MADASDIATVLNLARETGLELAIRSGGHSAAGHSTSDGGIVVDLRSLKSLEIDVESRTAWADSGLTAAEYSNQTNAVGLATGLGDTGSVGLGGITLGGGIGFLVRKHGMTIDSLLADEVVTAAGEMVLADEESHPDLFWAIRGGGGDFGVATKFHLRLQPLDRIVGGMMILPATVGNHRRVHRRGGAGSRRAVDHRQRHELPAPAIRARGDPRQPRDHGPGGLVRRHR